MNGCGKESEYVKNKKKKALEERLATLESGFKDITRDVGTAAHLDAPDEARIPEDARRRDSLAEQIAEAKRQLEELK